MPKRATKRTRREKAIIVRTSRESPGGQSIKRAHRANHERCGEMLDDGGRQGQQISAADIPTKPKRGKQTGIAATRNAGARRRNEGGLQRQERAARENNSLAARAPSMRESRRGNQTRRIGVNARSRNRPDSTASSLRRWPASSPGRPRIILIESGEMVIRNLAL